MGYGVIGNSGVFEALVPGSSPGTPAIFKDGKCWELV